MMDMDLRGMPLTALFAASARAPLGAALAQVASGARATLSVQGEAGFGQPQLAGRLALLPLTDESGAITRAGRSGASWAARPPAAPFCQRTEPAPAAAPSCDT